MTTRAQEPPIDISLPRLLGLGMGTRLLVDTAMQIFAPFLTIFAAGLGVDVVTMGRLISVRTASGVLAPLLGSLADRHGYRKIMRLSLLLAIGGLLCIGSGQTLGMVVVGMILLGFGISSFVPVLHAYLSTRLPYAVRARGLGMLEYSWALAGIVGLYSAGQLIEALGWRGPLFILASALAVMWGLLGLLPAARVPAAAAIETTGPRQAGLRLRLRNFFDLGQHARSAYAAIVADMLIFYAGMQLMLVHGAWLNAEYQLGAAALGTVALLLGCFDLVASVSVSLFTDRIGKRRSVLLGTVGMVLGYVLMPWLNVTLPLAILSIALTRSSFEFGIVSFISLMSEQAPNRRGKVLSLSSAFALAGGTLASLTGPWLYVTYGVPGLSLSSMVAGLLSIIILVSLVQEQSDSDHQ
ncbi:MAG: MFS transporter [Caldilineaceae bacterium]